MNSNKTDIVIRPATSKDASFIARNILDAMGVGKIEGMLRELTRICRMEDTLYSWKRTYIVQVDGTSAGSLTSYDGALYKELKDRTFSIISAKTGEDYSGVGEETRPGEYYLDSLAIIPEYRSHHLGSLLIDNALHIAQGLGFTLASLIAEKDKVWLQHYYESLGFYVDGELLFFGHQYVRMIQEI